MRGSQHPDVLVCSLSEDPDQKEDSALARWVADPANTAWMESEYHARAPGAARVHPALLLFSCPVSVHLKPRPPLTAVASPGPTKPWLCLPSDHLLSASQHPLVLADGFIPVLILSFVITARDLGTEALTRHSFS